jgi:ferritin-like metal-binding protein YciE
VVPVDEVMDVIEEDDEATNECDAGPASIDPVAWPSTASERYTFARTWIGQTALETTTSLAPERPMSDTTSSKARDIYIVGLRNQHAVEKQAIELLERQVGRLENYPEVADRMRRHIEESREQAHRLEDLLAQYDTSQSALKDSMMSLVGNLAALGHSMAPDEVVKNTFANFAFEHYEIASYMSLLTLSEMVGDSRGDSALKASLAEERDMAAWIAEHISATTRRFVQRSAAHETAGV